MTENRRDEHRPRTTPSEAVGESGDQEARREADEAVVDDKAGTRGTEGTRGDAGDAGDRGHAGDGGTEDTRGAQGHEAKLERPGLGREEQTRPYPSGVSGADDGAPSRSDDD
ncbi:hypothetical protein [Streptomyces sp. NPDC093600]|uniref:hypothetical protein n=1 Tax=Streptomyces sp. NPDC093600 TaxID=3366047 RepID=UPI00380ADC49